MVSKVSAFSLNACLLLWIAGSIQKLVWKYFWKFTYFDCYLSKWLVLYQVEELFHHFAINIIINSSCTVHIYTISRSLVVFPSTSIISHFWGFIFQRKLYFCSRSRFVIHYRKWFRLNPRFSKIGAFCWSNWTSVSNNLWVSSSVHTEHLPHTKSSLNVKI